MNADEEEEAKRSTRSRDVFLPEAFTSSRFSFSIVHVQRCPRRWIIVPFVLAWVVVADGPRNGSTLTTAVGAWHMGLPLCDMTQPATSLQILGG